MENASDALIMAGSVLLFIIALTVAISSLVNLRTQTQDLLNSRDQLLITTDNTGGYLNYLKSGNQDNDVVRTVGIETIITSIRRMTKEDYIIYIIPKNKTTYLLGSEYNDLKDKVEDNDNAIRLTISGVSNRYVSSKNLTKLLFLIHNKLGTSKFEESIGTYQNKTSEGVSEANKSTFKIITYKQI